MGISVSYILQLTRTNVRCGYKNVFAKLPQYLCVLNTAEKDFECLIILSDHYNIECVCQRLWLIGEANDDSNVSINLCYGYYRSVFGLHIS